MRCPADAIVSEWNRKQGIPAGGSKHKVRAPQEAFGKCVVCHYTISLLYYVCYKDVLVGCDYCTEISKFLYCDTTSAEGVVSEGICVLTQAPVMCVIVSPIRSQ